MSNQLSMAYTVCRGVARAQARNFYWAFLVLPREKRNALCAVYAFMRHADDLSDEHGISQELRHNKLIEWSENVMKAMPRGHHRISISHVSHLKKGHRKFKINIA